MPSPQSTLPSRTAPRPSPKRRWDHWQTSLVAQQYLTPEAVARGYTLLRVPLQSREAFFDCASLLLAQLALEQHRAALLEHPRTARLVEDADAAWNAWRLWTRRVTAYLLRLSKGQTGTMPPVTPEMQALVDLLKGGSDALSAL